MSEPRRLRALLAGYARTLEGALLAADTEGAERVARDALSAGLPAALIDDGVVRPAMTSIGDRWARGEISTGEEHVATGLVARLLVLLRDMDRVEQSRRDTKVLLAAAEGERHVIGLAMAADLMEDAGFTVVFAGADVPVPSLATLIERHTPDLLALSATMPGSAASLRASVRLAHETGVTGVLTGGAVSRRVLEPAPWVQSLDGLSGLVHAADGLVRAAALN